jgi:hypothetical protein
MACVLHHSRASGTDKVVLLGIANHDGDGGAWPAIATLARYANVTERAVQAAVARLIEMGEVEVVHQEGGDRRLRNDRRPNLYRVLVSCPDSCDGSPQHRVQPTSPRDGNGVKASAPRGEVQRAHGVKPTSPEPSIEPSGTPLSSDASGTDASKLPKAVQQSPFLTDAKRLCRLLADLIVENGCKPPKRTWRWVQDMDAVMRLDGRAAVEVETVIRWAQQDEFWRVNVLSPAKLREKFDQLRLARERQVAAARPRLAVVPDDGRRYVPPPDPAEQLAAAMAHMDPVDRARYEDDA